MKFVVDFAAAEMRTIAVVAAAAESAHFVGSAVWFAVLDSFAEQLAAVDSFYLDRLWS